MSKSSYYQYRTGETYQSSQAEQQMVAKVEEVFWENRRRYGSRRVQKALQEEGIEVGRHQVRRGSPPGLMQEQNWRAIQPRSFMPRTTDSRHGLRACPNLLLELGQPIRPNQVWVSDITYLPLIGGDWAYLASWLERSAVAVVLASNRRRVCRFNHGGELDYQGFRPGSYLTQSTARLDRAL